MLVRYRYRIDPTPGQRQALARAFGCARVVYNDALAERQRAFAAGEKLSDSEVQRRVVTLAKKTPERAWLAEVASVALVQACQDARRAYRNWFDSRSGKRKGRRVGQPRFRTKHGRQVDPAHPQRLRPARDQAVCGQGRRAAGALVARAAVGAVQRHRHPGAGRPLLRLVRGRARPDPAAAGGPHRRDRSWPSLVRCGRWQRRHRRAGRQPAVSAARPAAARPRPAAACPASARGRPTAPRPGCGSQSPTARFATGGPITTTSSPFG